MAEQEYKYKVNPSNDWEQIELVNYDRSVMKPTVEESLVAYLNIHDKELLKKEHYDIKDCISYISRMARERAKDNMAAISSEVVFKWAVNFFTSPLEKVEVKPIKPIVKPETEEEKKKKEEERQIAEQLRKAEEERKRIEAEEEKKAKEIAKNGLMLFDL